MKHILVAGAHGTTGQIVVQLLKASKDYVPIAMVRSEEQVRFFEAQGVKTVLADLEKDVSDSTEKMDKVIFAAGSGGKKVVEVDQEGAKKLVDASKKAGVKKFVMLSSIGAGHPEKANQLQEYLKAKHNADEYLKKNDIDYTIIRPGTLNNDSGTGKIKLAEELESRGEVTREDVAQVLVNVLDSKVAKKAIFEFVNGEVPIEKALEKVS
ncbi:MAG: SDR family oxidoreductase [Pricia sp.]